jgi:hypothetical protein
VENELGNIHEFLYPIEYDPPVLRTESGKIIDGNNGLPSDKVVAVTPATPTNFESRNIGLIGTRTVNAHPDGRIKLTISLEKPAFKGNINYGAPIKGNGTTLSENLILMPVFGEPTRLKTSRIVSNGHYLVIGPFPASAPFDHILDSPNNPEKSGAHKSPPAKHQYLLMHLTLDPPSQR